MNVEIGKNETTQFHFWEYINRIFFAMRGVSHIGRIDLHQIIETGFGVVLHALTVLYSVKQGHPFVVNNVTTKNVFRVMIIVM
jgi:hypothetical protein